MYKLHQLGIDDRTWLLINKYYESMNSEVAWEGETSNLFPIKQGVRQGGILSPLLYIIYIDGLIKTMRKTTLGVTTNGSYVGILAFADDICLMLEIAAAYAMNWAYKYNEAKTVYICFHQHASSPSKGNLYLNGNTIKQQETHKYTRYSLQEQQQRNQRRYHKQSPVCTTDTIQPYRSWCTCLGTATNRLNTAMEYLLPVPNAIRYGCYQHLKHTQHRTKQTSKSSAKANTWDFQPKQQVQP